MSATKLSETEINELIKKHLGWTFDKENMFIIKDYELKGYYKTILFVNQIAWIAQKLNHHPDLEVKFGKVKVKYQTHDVDGISDLDFKAASEIDNIIF